MFSNLIKRCECLKPLREFNTTVCRTEFIRGKGNCPKLSLYKNIIIDEIIFIKLMLEFISLHHI